MSFADRDLYKFKNFHLDSGEKALLKDGKDVSITPKAFQLLRILVENHGEVVKKDELISRIWENSFVEEGNLAFTARLLRKVLDDDAKHPTFVETVPRKGYRFIADVSTCSVPSTIRSASGIPTKGWRHSRYSFLSVALLILIVAVLASVSYFVRQTVVSNASAPILSMPFMAERLTSTGNAFQAVISPNGKLAAYTDLANGKWSLWLRRLETAENIQILPPSDASYGGLVFSRDGNSLFFARSEAGAKQLNIYRVNAFGGVPTKILENTQGWISISSDDSKISFVRCVYAREDYCSLFAANIDGSSEQKIVTRPEPIRIADNQFAPDGKSIAFAAGQSRTASDEFGLFLIDLDTGQETEITSRRFFNIKYLKWLHNGEGLLLSARHSLSHKFSIWSVHSTSGATTQLTSDDANFSGLSLDEKSEALVATKVDNDFAIYLVPPRDGNSRKLVAGKSVSFTPGGSVVYESPDRDIWTIDPDGSSKRQLTNGSFTDACPLLSPDGRIIFFSSNRSGVNQVWRMNIDGSDQRQLTRVEGGYPSFVTPQGDWLYYRAGITNSFRKIGTDGSDEQSVAEIDKFADAFSPDGRLLAYFDNETAGPRESLKIGVRALVDQTLVQMMRPDHVKGELLTLQWSSDSRSILYVVKEAGVHHIWRWRLDQSKPELLMDLGIEPVERIVVSPDGLSIAKVQGKWLNDAYLITGLNNSSYPGTGLSR